MISMKRQKKWLFVFPLSIFFFIISLQWSYRQTSTSENPSASSKLLKKLTDEYWNFLLEDSLGLRLKLGATIQKLPDLSIEKAKADAQFAKFLMKAMSEVKVEDLSHEESISLEILRWELENIIDSLKFYWLVTPITPYSSPFPMINGAFLNFRFEKETDLDQYLTLLKEYPLFIQILQNKLQNQYSRSIILPKAELSLVIPFLTSFIHKGDQSLFFVNKDRLKKIDDATKSKFQEKLAGIIDSEVNPALLRLNDFIKSDYLRKAPSSVGLWQYPGGREYYKHLIKVYTTMELTPEEIHHIGLEQVEKINAKVEEMRKSLGFKGTLAGFRYFLKTDSRFFAKTPDEIRTKLLSFVEAMDRKLNLFFSTRPKAPYGVERLASELEGSVTFGSYEPPSVNEPRGIYYFNGSIPEKRSLLWAESLIYHELIPGHHFHFALQSENSALPIFRRGTFHNAFNEGWAEYASWLGLEIELFQDPFSLCGKYQMDMLFAARLVVDTGMNYFEWPRSRAERFMEDHLVESTTQIESETLRYSVDMPGQALGYKLGSMKMFELREKAKKKLGAKFDIRKFNDALVGSGSMPFPVLEKHMDWFIKNELSGTNN